MNRNRLILETGATKSRYAILDGNDRVLYSGTSSAFNPNIHTIQDLLSILKSTSIHGENLHQVIAFVAGYNEKHFSFLKSSIAKVLPNREISIFSDLESIGYILSKGQKSWIGILGTGSSFAFWDGRQIERHIPGFGYIIGDEGSGRHIAAEIAKSFYRRQFSQALMSRLGALFPHSYARLIQLIYKENQWPAISSALMKSLEPYWQEPELMEVAKACIDELLQKVVRPSLKSDTTQTFLCGGVALAYKNYICEHWPTEIQPEIYASPFDILIKTENEY